MSHLKTLYTFIFISIIFAIGYLFFKTSQTQILLNQNVEKILINEAKSFARNINLLLQKNLNSSPYETLKQHREIHENLENSLSVLRSNTYKYVFVLYRDVNGNYRFLLDGSKEKAAFNQRLNVDKQLWDRAYTTQKPLIVNQKKLDGLWITYLLPFVVNGKTEGIIAIDFSKELPQNIYNAIAPLNHIILYIFIAIGFLIIILIYQTILSIKSKKESITDPLTQTYNRNYMRELLQKMNIIDYQIMMCDIDYFKQINDHYGHKAGDEVLAKTAQIINEEIRPDDILIRYGGEEFLLFIKRSNNREMLAYTIAQRIRTAIEKTHFKYENEVIRITLSIGITCNPEHFKSISSAIKYADEMLYIAKREGRNKVVSTKYRGQQKTLPKKKSINEVKSALEENRILCYFQAIYCLQNNTILKYEALVRLQEKDGVILSPDTFLDTIMYTNIYNDITKTVLRSVFHHIRKHKVTISTNLNFSDILDNTIFKLILNEIQTHKELAPWLIIELLEYEVCNETTSIVKERLTQIKGYGVRIALDDFGSGYANYAIFKTIPIDILKIDGSLIKDLNSSKTSKTIVDSIVLLAKEMNIKTVAEFVHSKEILEEVKKLGVDEAQGFYLSKPSATID